MSVGVYVLPLGTWLSGAFRTTWGEGAETPSARPRRSEEEAGRLLESFKDGLEGLLTFRPDWAEDGPALRAVAFSAEGFARPFHLARRWSTRLEVPLLSTLEPPQIWIPADFAPLLRIAAPWDPETTIMAVSTAGVKAELEAILEAIAEEHPDEDAREAWQVTRRLRECAELGLEHRVPVIVEA